jgi:hypothetical protein
MSQNTEIFENEEASKFLDYFVAYMKLMDKVDNIKNIASQHSEVNLTQTQPIEQHNALEVNNSEQLACLMTIEH